MLAGQRRWKHLHDDDPSERVALLPAGNKCGADIALGLVVIAVGVACGVCKIATRGLWVEASLIRGRFECVGWCVHQGDWLCGARNITATINRSELVFARDCHISRVGILHQTCREIL